MKKIDAIKLIGQRLSGRAPEDLYEFISTEMQLVQEGILEGKAFIPWFLSSVHEYQLEPGLEKQVLPSGFLQADIEEACYVVLESGQKREVIPVDKADAVRLSPARSGAPWYYSLVGVDSIEFFPALDQAYDVVFSFFQQDRNIKDLGDEEENLWLKLAPNVFINEVGKVCAEILRDKDAFTLFAARAEAAWADLEGRHLERRFAGQHLGF